jgi:glycosyltransferase involved in cell wall biosynthesis
MAAGLPLIVTAYGGHADFVGPDVARLIDYRFAASRSHLAAPGSVWVDPDKADLAAALRETMDRARGGDASGDPLGSQVARARRTACLLGDRPAWGRRVADSARRLLAADAPSAVSVGWVSTWGIRCGIAEYSRHLLSRYENAVRDVVVFCDERTRKTAAASSEAPPARIAWRLQDRPSMDRLAGMIDEAGVEAAIVQHHDGYMRWEDLAALLRDPRLRSRPVLAFLHHVRDLFKFEAGERAEVVEALGLCTRVLVHSVADLNILKSFGLVDNLTLFPHGAEPGKLAPRPARGFDTGKPPLLGAYGFFLPPKGFDCLIGALPALRARWPGLRLRFVTAEHQDSVSAEEIERCRELARSLGVARAIEWNTDYLPNRRSLKLLNRCDLIVLPYRETSESASGAARIALASRAPVAVTPIRIFEEFDNAVLRLPDGSPDDIARGIAAMLDDEDRRRQAIEAADKWLEDHDWRVMAARLRGMVTGIVATNRT